MINQLVKLGHVALADPRANVDSHWYAMAGAWCSALGSDYGLAPNVVAGMVAALSPLQSWQSQVKYTPPSLMAWLSFQSPLSIAGPGFFSNKNKAHRILAGESPAAVLSGDKVTRFFANLTGNLSVVTVDEHGFNAAGWARSRTPSAYRRVEFAYRMAARKFDLAPAEFQAVIWNYWRRNFAEHKQHNNK